MLYSIRRIATRILRIPRSRGFGVQSPSAYRFIRYVLNERYPYYAYGDLRQRFPHLGKQQRRICELYFRLANYAQAEEWWEISPSNVAEQAYISAGCQKSRLTKDSIHPGVICMDAEAYAAGVFDSCAEKAAKDTLLIIVGIHRNYRCYQFWRQMAQDNRTSLSFDLFDCGILFFDNRTKQHYKVNY